MSARVRAWFQSARVAANSTAECADGDLVRRFADAHDEGAFAELVRRHGPMVLATCRRILHPDVHTADDAFQAAFLVLATKAAAVSPPERVGAWLHGVAVHVAMKARAWVRKIAPSAPSDLDRVPAVIEADPDAADLRAKLDEVLAGLPPKYRAAVVLCELEGRSRAEAAAALGWSEGTLSSRLARARKLLADRLARRGVALPAAGLGVALPASAATASVPGQLAASTFRAATLVAAGATAGDAIPASVAALAQGFPMHTTTFKLLAAGLACAALAFAGFGLYALTAADPPAPEKPPVVKSPAPAAAEKGWAVAHTLTHKGAVTAVAFGPGLVAVGDDTNELVLCDAQAGKRKVALAQIKGVVEPDGSVTAESIDQLRFSPDGAKLIAVTGGGKVIRQFTVEKPDGKAPYYRTAAKGWKTVGITTNGGGWVHLSEKESVASISPDKLDGNFMRWFCFHQFPHKDAIQFAAAADSHGTAVATVSGKVKTTLRLWSRFNKEPLWEVQIGQFEVTGLVVSPDSKWIAITDKAGQVRIYDAKTTELQKEIAKTATVLSPAHAAAFSPDGKQILAGFGDKTARVYDTKTGEQLAVLKGHAGAVTAVAFSPDGKYIVTGSDDKTAKVWEYKP